MENVDNYTLRVSQQCGENFFVFHSWGVRGINDIRNGTTTLLMTICDTQTDKAEADGYGSIDSLVQCGENHFSFQNKL